MKAASKLHQIKSIPVVVGGELPLPWFNGWTGTLGQVHQALLALLRFPRETYRQGTVIGSNVAAPGQLWARYCLLIGENYLRSLQMLRLCCPLTYI